MSRTGYFDAKEHRDLKEMLAETTAKFGDRTAFWVKKDGPESEYSPITYNEYQADVNALGTALICMGLKGKNIVVIGKNSYDYATAYMAIVNGTGCIVPIDPKLPEREIENLLTRSEAAAVFVAEEQAATVTNVVKKAPTVKHIIGMPEGSPEKGILGFSEVMASGKEALASGDRRFLDAEVDNGIMNMLIFTSGTTSDSKGVMLSHKNICSDISGLHGLVKFDENDSFLSVLPMHHSYEATGTFINSISVGASIGFCDEVPKTVGKNLKELKPTLMACVPLLVEIFHKKAWDAIEAKGKRKLVEKLLSNWLGAKIARKLLFKPIYKSLGGRLRLLTCGGSAASPQAMKGMRNFGVLTVGGYGQTETAPILSINQVENFRDDSSMGMMLPNVECRIDNRNEDGVGELVVKGPMVMLGYYKDLEATEAAFTKDGFLKTGDAVRRDKDGFYYHVDRLKNIFKSKNGESVYPAEIETLLNSSPYVSQSMIFQEKFTRDSGIEDLRFGVVIYPELERIKTDIDDANEDKIMLLLQKEVDTLNEKLPSFKRIINVVASDKPLPMTSLGKVKKHKVELSTGTKAYDAPAYSRPTTIKQPKSVANA